jgi:hypothetical protein
MANKWISHVKSVANKKGISYGEALKVASKTYKRTMKGRGAEEERAERAQMMEEELSQGVWLGQVKKPSLMLSPDEMVGTTWERVKNSPTLQHYTERRGWNPEDLSLLYDNMREDVKNQYDTPRNYEELFHILKNQRSGMLKRRR